MTPYILTSVPGVKIVERGRKIDEEKINEGRLEGERFFRSCPPPPPPIFPVYNLTRSPLTATLYYLSAWNGLTNQLQIIYENYVLQQTHILES